MTKQDERTFEEVVRSIANSEEDVDKVLSAARLDRHEQPPRYLSADQKMTIILSVIGLLAGCAMFAFLLLGSVL